jgi:hypothetical protein
MQIFVIFKLIIIDSVYIVRLYLYSDSWNLWAVMKAGGLAFLNLIQSTISLEMPVPSQGHYVFTVFRLLTDFVCLYTYEFRLSLCKIIRSSVILFLPLFAYWLNTPFRLTCCHHVLTEYPIPFNLLPSCVDWIPPPFKMSPSCVDWIPPPL